MLADTLIVPAGSEGVNKMSEKVVGGILPGFVEASGFFTSSVVNSKAEKMSFALILGEIVLASLGGSGLSSANHYPSLLRIIFFDNQRRVTATIDGM